ncbi:zinc-dependent alcohol dehydrogenase [Aspergillus clavatus NRRL 1]|uniref:Alcohol dehydrogenase, putative n=1 Tax=Aspergillus clavatus (strain ATCC 1007 / CBS 513.65 / DSM 816 / NCTC 3887 / NRRL 1 / QM 1276 / 107) TaxID=344612 RepID=A1CDC5_ASPCL|nr:alcohol dehydrogenase, putative [Aspergillus clavatus NRRL 1]EAW11852.1 alcohol dehydrogenase, putative [Aspergillus clavatus NRRL 1]
MTDLGIPKKQKAVVYDQPGTNSTKIEEIDVPEPGPGEVLINLTHSGVCHSDYGVMTNSWSSLPLPAPAGQVGGHEGVGKVVKFGPGAEESGLKIGDRVGVKWVSSACGNCQPCQAGSDGLCFKQKISGYFSPGTFQQYTVGPANYVTPIPDGLASEEAAPMLCAGVTVYAALKRSHARPGQWVVISGAGGGLGHIAVQLASRGMGLRVIGIDHGSKEALVKESGAEHFVDITQFPTDDKGEAIAAHVQSLADGLGSHAAIVCTASNAAYAQALLMLRFNGTLVCVGVPEHSPQPIATAFPGFILEKLATITGSAVGNRTEALETLEFAARGIIKAHVRTEKMDALTSIFQEMAEGKLQGRVVLDLS